MFTERRHSALALTHRVIVTVCVLCSLGTGFPLCGQLPGAPDAQPAATDASLEEARRFIQNGRYQAAIDLLTGMAKAVPGRGDVHALLGLSYLRLNKPAASLREYTLEGALKTPSPADLQNVAKDYILLKDDADAEHWALVAVQMDDRNAESWYVLGRIRYTLQRFQEAIDCFDRSLTLAPRSVKAENNRGLALEALNKTEDAVAAYRQAIAWQQNSAERSEQPLLNLGMVLTHEGRLEEAAGLFAEAAAIAPNDPRICQEQGQLFLRQGRLADAQIQFEKAVRLDPDKAALHFLLGKVYNQEGHTAQAEAEFAKTRALSGYQATPLP